MIGYLEGKLLKKDEDRILLLVSQVGYEVLLPAIVMEGLSSKSVGDMLSLYIYYHQTERQPVPVLIGFHHESEKEFFQDFIAVEDIGPLKAVKALHLPISEIAEAIESQNIATLKRLKGIGDRTAKKIIATLGGKMAKFVIPGRSESERYVMNPKFTDPVLEVLTSQLGYKTSDAKQMIEDTLKQKPNISTPEELFDEIYRRK
jgi:Holliday junction DNA helicase RuvA